MSNPSNSNKHKIQENTQSIQLQPFSQPLIGKNQINYNNQQSQKTAYILTPTQKGKQQLLSDQSSPGNIKNIYEKLDQITNKRSTLNENFHKTLLSQGVNQNFRDQFMINEQFVDRNIKCNNVEIDSIEGLFPEIMKRSSLKQNQEHDRIISPTNNQMNQIKQFDSMSESNQSNENQFLQQAQTGRSEILYSQGVSNEQQLFFKVNSKADEKKECDKQKLKQNKLTNLKTAREIINQSDSKVNNLNLQNEIEGNNSNRRNEMEINNNKQKDEKGFNTHFLYFQHVEDKLNISKSAQNISFSQRLLLTKNKEKVNNNTIYSPLIKQQENKSNQYQYKLDQQISEQKQLKVKDIPFHRFIDLDQKHDKIRPLFSERKQSDNTLNPFFPKINQYSQSPKSEKDQNTQYSVSFNSQKDITLDKNQKDFIVEESKNEQIKKNLKEVIVDKIQVSKKSMNKPNCLFNKSNSTNFPFELIDENISKKITHAKLSKLIRSYNQANSNKNINLKKNDLSNKSAQLYPFLDETQEKQDQNQTQKIEENNSYEYNFQINTSPKNFKAISQFKRNLTEGNGKSEYDKFIQQIMGEIKRNSLESDQNQMNKKQIKQHISNEQEINISKETLQSEQQSLQLKGSAHKQQTQQLKSPLLQSQRVQKQQHNTFYSSREYDESRQQTFNQTLAELSANQKQQLFNLSKKNNTFKQNDSVIEQKDSVIEESDFFIEKSKSFVEKNDSIFENTNIFIEKSQSFVEQRNYFVGKQKLTKNKSKLQKQQKFQKDQKMQTSYTNNQKSLKQLTITSVDEDKHQNIKLSQSQNQQDNQLNNKSITINTIQIIKQEFPNPSESTIHDRMQDLKDFYKLRNYYGKKYESQFVEKKKPENLQMKNQNNYQYTSLQYENNMQLDPWENNHSDIDLDDQHDTQF